MSEEEPRQRALNPDRNRRVIMVRHDLICYSKLGFFGRSSLGYGRSGMFWENSEAGTKA